MSHNDTPTVKDAFGNEAFIEAICLLVRTCTPPKGIGINGYWGTGKTSALLQIYQRLTGSLPKAVPAEAVTGTPDKKTTSEVTPVWFEAWRYQHESQPIVALLHEIRAQMGLMQKVQGKVGKLAGVAFLGTLTAFDEVIKVASGGNIKPELGKLAEIGRQWEAERLQQRLPSQVIQSLLQGAIGAVLGNKKRLVIFIDDLDRCEPETALRLMEGIKVYLDLNNCVIIFGMDQRQVERALAKALGISDNNAAHHAREYLEKICQDIIHLPLADKAVKSTYLESLLMKLKVAAATVEQIKKVTDTYDVLPANPRKIKALANRIAFMCRRLCSLQSSTTPLQATEPEKVPRNAALLLLIAICHCFHRAVYEQLQKNPAYIATVLEYAQSSASLDELQKNPDYLPMRDILPSLSAGKELPCNPSDSNVFRLHQLLNELQSITTAEIEEYLLV